MTTTHFIERRGRRDGSLLADVRRITVDRLYPTKVDLPAEARAQVAILLNQRLADALDLGLQCKHAHWNVRGPSFYALHQLFDAVHADVMEYADLVAERIAQLGGVADGTIAAAAARTTLVDYPGGARTEDEHVAALSDALAQFGRTARLGIEELQALGDADGADILTQVSRGIDRWLWMVEAHRSGAAVPLGDATGMLP